MIHRYTIEEHRQRGEILAKSGLFDCSQPAQGQGISIFCEDSGITLAEFRNKFHFANGLMQPRAGFMLAEFLKSGGKHKWIKDGSDGKEACIELTDKYGQTYKVSFTIEEAKKRGIFRSGGIWETATGEMLRARAITRAINMADPGLAYIESEPSDEPAPLPPQQESKQPLLPEKETIEQPAVEPKKVKSTDRKKTEPKVEVASEPEPKPNPEPEKKPAPQPKPEPVEDKSNPELIPTPKTQKPQLSDDLVDQLSEALTGCELAAGEFFIREKWLQPGEGIGSLNEVQARRILKNVDSFIKAIGGPF